MARQNFVGLVVSQGKMSKTVKVRVQGKIYDRRIDKEVITRKDFLVHDEGEICKEGDIVRIEHLIPKISKRKAYAIAEIKVNKGQQFELYDSMAKTRLQQENKSKVQDFVKQKEVFQKTVNQLEDLRKLDQLVSKAQEIANKQFEEGASSTTGEDQEKLLKEIEAIKVKYNITSYPTPQEIVKLEINQLDKSIKGDEFLKRSQNIQFMLSEINE